jgi:hypothetical protein
VTVRVLLLAVAAVLGGAAPASAAEVSLRVTPQAGVRLGNELRAAGRVTEQGAAVASRRVALEVRRYPFKRRWRRSAVTVTRPDGSFSFPLALERNHRVRARLLTAGGDGVYVPPRIGGVSRVRQAYVLPAFTLSFAQRGADGIRIRQVYTVPRDVRLRASTRFYIARRGSRRARLRAVVPTRRVRPGRYVATATVRIPPSFGGRFRYVSCFPYSRGSGMGDPGTRCPRRFARLS